MSTDESKGFITLAAWLSDEEPSPPDLGVVRLPRVSLGDAPGPQVDLVLGETLGSGGMAIVRRANQLALDREVAVKQARKQEPATIAALVREAAITARLQHPNIVPVHFVGETEEGEPLVVMPILGTKSWQDLAAHPDVGLSRHIEVAKALCSALSYTHAAGYVHRDVKPANVRIGEYGEVYLLDWGIAAPMDGRIRRPAGTHAYLAPEANEPRPVDPRLDVFCLAASLSAVLSATGRPVRSDDGGIKPPAGLPPGLARVLARAGAADVSRRTPDIDTFRADLAHWEEEQEVEALLAAADSHRADLEAERDLPAVREQFAVARFAYRHVLDRRPAHPEAHQGLVRCYDFAIRAELDGGDIATAEAWLQAHPAPTEALIASIASLRAKQQHAEAEDARLRAIARATDLSHIRGASTRILTGVVAATLASFLLNRAILGPPLPSDGAAELSWRLVGMIFFPWLALVGLVQWQHPSLTRSPAGIRSAHIVRALATLVLLGRLGFAMGGLSIGDRPVALVCEPLLLVAFCLGYAQISRRFLVAAALSGLSWLAVVAAYESEALTLVFNLALTTSIGAMSWAWFATQRDLDGLSRDSPASAPASADPERDG